jgi:hypothetical protein
MAAASESQGLKIAVAAFITTTVGLAVGSYFLYSNAASAEARLASEQEAHNATKKDKGRAVQEYSEMRGKIGTAAEEFDQAKDEIAANFKKIDERLNNLTNAVNTAVQNAQAGGAQGPELEEAKQNVQKAIASFRSEPNKNYVSSLDRLTELMENLSLLATQLSLNYLNVRQSLEGATNVGKQQVDAQAKAAAESQADLLGEQKKHAEERQTLLTKVDQLQTESDKRQTEITNLTSKNKQQEDDFNRQRETLTTILREQRDQLERSRETVLDRPDGYITYVDYLTREVLVSLTRRMGARPQMRLTVFDAKSPGIPTDKPKGNIELTSVGEQFSTARIVKTDSPIDPIRVGDIIYSAAWSPNQPMRFALVGKMDVNRDSKDDRAELKRMIEEAGGVVEFDLPPADLGKETGTLSPRIDWYVIDERMPIRDAYVKSTDVNTAAASKLETRVGEVVKEARLNGIRPMPIGRLLTYLGYDMNAPIMGRAEAVDTKALQRLTAPRQAGQALTKTAGETTKAESTAEDAAADQPKSKPASGKAAPKQKAAPDEGAEPK